MAASFSAKRSSGRESAQFGTQCRRPGDVGRFRPLRDRAAKKTCATCFVPNFYFGCEADDPITAGAFDAKRNPFGARLNVVFGSDIGHFDVPDMNEVTEEA